MGTTRNIFLYPVSLVYGFITGFRNFLYDSGIFNSTEFAIPVICVGNITVGGTGKTPHTEYLVDLLGKYFKVATLSRGYKRKTRDFRIASPSSRISEIGDEPMQIHRKYPDTLVTVDRKRVHGVRKIMEADAETEVIILDDGFQHRSITPGFSILLSDFERPYLTDHMLPYGNLRESKTNIRRADILLITKCPENLTPLQRRLIVKDVNKAPYQNLYFTTLSYKAPLPLFGEKESGRSPLVMSECSDKELILITGIANPQPFKEYLKKFFKEITHFSYSDHYSFKEKDIIDISAAFDKLSSHSKFLFTTEKDAVRLQEFTNIADHIKAAFYYIPVGIDFLNDDKNEFDNLIVDYVRKNRRDNRISEK
jgi:tetraacyldisaccharide 4'-kinase